MSLNKKIVYLLLTLATVLYVPYIASYIKYKGKLPDGKLYFPPVEPIEKAGFNLPIFITITIIFIGVLLLFILPQLFGFKKYASAKTKDKSQKIKLPIWFTIGLVIWLTALGALSLKLSEPKWLINWAVLPLFWGFALMLDGVVYIRNNRSSLISRSLRELMAIGILSIPGWLFFEYLNFFVNRNWYYPRAALINHEQFLLYAVIGSSGLMPMAFEWYHLLRTFEPLRNKYKHGLKINLSGPVKSLLLILSLISLGAADYFPDYLFFILWLAPLIILTVILGRLGILTPFTPIKEGNWTPLLLFALTYLIQGFLLEAWNYASGSHIAGNLHTWNPAYWAYSIPFVDCLHVFEMPVLGYLGYVPFGIYCWVWWIFSSFLLNISRDYTSGKEFW